MKLEIDGDTADRIVVCSLKETIEYLKGDIKLLRSKKKLKDHEKRQLAENVVELDAMEKVYNYYGGNYE